MKKYTYIICLYLLAANAFASDAQVKTADNTPDPQTNDAQYQCMQWVLTTVENPKEITFDYFGNFAAFKEQDGIWVVEATYALASGKKRTSTCRLELKENDWKKLDIKTK